LITLTVDGRDRRFFGDRELTRHEWRRPKKFPKNFLPPNEHETNPSTSSFSHHKLTRQIIANRKGPLGEPCANQRTQQYILVGKKSTQKVTNQLANLSK
jgi:hypothetical protein